MSETIARAPWKSFKVLVPGLAADDPRWSIIELGAERRSIANDIQRKDTADLLTAAPQMYEALKEAGEWLRLCHLGVVEISPDELRATITAALAAARGEG